MSHNSTARVVRLRKQARPELYCIHRECLHTAPCPKHCNPSEPLQHHFQPEQDNSASCFFCGGYLTDPRHNNVTTREAS